MYLNASDVMSVGEIIGLTVTLDVFKFFLHLLYYCYLTRLTVTLDVFKCLDIMPPSAGCGD